MPLKEITGGCIRRQFEKALHLFGYLISIIALIIIEK